MQAQISLDEKDVVIRFPKKCHEPRRVFAFIRLF